MQNDYLTLVNPADAKKEDAAIKNQHTCRLWKTVLALLMIGLLNLLGPAAAGAEPSQSLEITGDGVSSPITFNLPQLQAMQQYQHIYSTINTWPTKKWYVGKGVKLRDLMDLTGIKDDARLVTFTSSDGYTVTLTVKELFSDKRYYFPNLMGDGSTDGSISGSGEGAVEVEPILALVSTEGKKPENMNDMDSLFLMCGQRSVIEQMNNSFLKYVSKIEVLTAAPVKWDSPRANIPGGEVAKGILIELTTKGNDADKIHYTTDGTTPTVNSPIYNRSAKRWWSLRPDNLSSINKPIEITRDTVIKAITIGPGKEDSDVVTFSYRIGSNSSSSQQKNIGSPTGVTLDESQVNLKVGASYQLEAFIAPYNATNKEVVWSSSDTRVATVDNQGLVTVIGSGTATVTATTVTGGFTATCTVTVGNESRHSQITAPIKNDLTVNGQQETPVEPQAGKEIKPSPEANQGASTDTSSSNKTPESEAEPIPEANQSYLAAKDFMPDKAAITSDLSSQPDVNLGGTIMEISLEDAVPLPLEPSSVYMVIIFFMFFFSGAITKYAEYSKEVKS
ncbi:MAG: Ig-like domain-containing protein [Syntrophomonas sp.]